MLGEQLLPKSFLSVDTNTTTVRSVDTNTTVVRSVDV